MLMKAIEQLELQFFNAATRRYERTGRKHADIERLAELARAAGLKSWRICKASRDLKPVFRSGRPYPFNVNGMSTADAVARVQRAYCDWAQSHGLASITAYLGRTVALGRYRGEVRRMSASEQFAVTEECESCD